MAYCTPKEFLTAHNNGTLAIVFTNSYETSNGKKTNSRCPGHIKIGNKKYDGLILRDLYGNYNTEKQTLSFFADKNQAPAECIRILNEHCARKAAENYSTIKYSPCYNNVTNKDGSITGVFNFPLNRAKTGGFLYSPKIAYYSDDGKSTPVLSERLLTEDSLKTLANQGEGYFKFYYDSDKHDKINYNTTLNRLQAKEVLQDVIRSDDLDTVFEKIHQYPLAILPFRGILKKNVVAWRTEPELLMLKETKHKNLDDYLSGLTSTNDDDNDYVPETNSNNNSFEVNTTTSNTDDTNQSNSNEETKNEQKEDEEVESFQI